MSAEARRKSPGLGRGLSALLGDREPEVSGEPGGVREIAISEISANADQPRRHFDTDALDELAKSITARGVLQPIVVRRVGNKFQIVAGERRWRSARIAKLKYIPALVRELDDGATLETALIENIQRAELNAIEEGEAFRRLIDQFGHSQEALAKLVHKSRSHVANLMRLLDLPAAVREALASGRLSMGHARALIGVPDAEAIAETAIAKGLSVRAVEKLAQRSKSPGPVRVRKAGGAPAEDGDIAMLARQIGEVLGMKVAIAHDGNGGSVTLQYGSLEELDMICQRLSGERI